jgi:hypothetical protein
MGNTTSERLVRMLLLLPDDDDDEARHQACDPSTTQYKYGLPTASCVSAPRAKERGKGRTASGGEWFRRMTRTSTTSGDGGGRTGRVTPVPEPGRRQRTVWNGRYRFPCACFTRQGSNGPIDSFFCPTRFQLYTARATTLPDECVHHEV